MNILAFILLAFIGIIGFALIIALFMKSEHYVCREIIINAPSNKIFEFLKFIKNQEKFNKWSTTDSDRITESIGTDGTTGYIYSWRGNKDAGHGAKEIIGIADGKKIEIEIRFTKPMKVKASMIMETDSVSESQTKVTFINRGNLKYPLNLMIPMAEKNFSRDLDESLSTLKKLFEN